MKKRRVAGTIVTVIGVSLSALSLYAASYIAGIKGALHSFTHVFGGNRVGGILTGEINKQASAYDDLIVGCFWSGIAILVAGLVMLLYSRKRRR